MPCPQKTTITPLLLFLVRLCFVIQISQRYTLFIVIVNISELCADLMYQFGALTL